MLEEENFVSENRDENHKEVKKHGATYDEKVTRVSID
jgi:hypothetical protein